jgi:hypothetical protein
MKLIQPVLFCVLIIALASCRHHWPNEGKVKTISNGDTLTCYYDNNGNLAYYSNGKGYKTAYEYRKQTITETTDGGSKVTMYLNSRGLVDSLVDIDTMRAFADGAPRKGVRPVRTFKYTGGHLLSYLDGGIASRNAEVITKKFVYDTAGNLIKQTEYVNGVLWAEASSVIEKENIASYTIRYFFLDTVSVVNPKNMEVRTSVIKLGDRMFSYSYDTEKLNSLAVTGIFGKCSKNLTVKMTDQSLPLSNKNESEVVSYKYTYDDKDRVSMLIKTEDGKEDTTVFTYY